MNKKAQLEELNIVGIIFGLVGAGIGFIVSNNMGSGIFIRLISGLICGVACYFVGGKIADG